MADPKILVTDGKTQWHVTAHELAELNRNRPTYLPPVQPVKEGTRVRAVYENTDGDIVDEQLPAESVIRRAQLGDNVAATPETIETARQARESREKMAVADDSDLTALLNAALPGAQFLQDLAVGEDTANQARQELNVNMAANLVGNLAEFAIGGKVAGIAAKGLLGAERAGKVGTALGFGKESSRLSRVGRVLAEEPAIETHFYIQNLLDTGDEFSSEEWARQVSTGMIFGAPFAGGAAMRGVGGAVRDAVGKSNALGMLQTALQAGTVVARPGTATAANRARAAATTGLANKFFRRGKKRRALGVTDEVAARQNQLLDDLDHLSVDVKKLDSMGERARGKWIDRYAAIADEPIDFVRDMSWGTLDKTTRKMGRQVEGVRRAARDVFKQLEGSGKHASWTTVELSQAARDRVLNQANEAMKFTTDVGMTEVGGTIRRKILTGNADAPSLRKALVEASFNAKLRNGVTPGADMVDTLLSEVLRDPKVWGASRAKQNVQVVDALDEIRQVWDDLGETHMTKKLGDLRLEDGLKLQKGQGAIERMRKATDRLADAGMLSERQITNFEARFIEADDAIRQGTAAYHDIIKFNRVQENAGKRLAKEAEVALDIPTTPESFAATKAEAALEMGRDIMELGTKGLDMLLATKPLAYAARGVGALHGLSEMEKYELYDQIHEELNSAVGNPQYFISSLGNQLDRGSRFDPVGADQVGAKVANTVYYLHSQMPKKDDTIFGRNVPQPLSAVEEFLEKWAAAADPVSVGYEALQGTVTPQMVNALRVTSPSTYAQMQVTIAELLSKVPAEKANPSALTGASIFLGGLDPMYSGKFISEIQSTYAQTTTQDEVINGPRRPASKVRNPGAPASLTISQRQQSY